MKRPNKQYDYLDFQDGWSNSFTLIDKNMLKTLL